MRHALHSLYKQAAELVVPPLSKSQFDEKRVITPKEFELAGDYLTRVCPTWSWERGDPKKQKSYLPAEKQYLVTRNVPCLQRASDIEKAAEKSEFAVQGEDDWVATHRGVDATADGDAGADVDIPGLDDDVAVSPVVGASGAAPTTTTTMTSAEGAAVGGSAAEEEIPDLTELELHEDDEATVVISSRPAASAGSGAGGSYLRAEEPGEEDAILRTRTYDLYITYDQYYQVPRFWLVGFDESRKPLSAAEVLEDVSEEHARKTVTLDAHPHVAMLSAASIHPCRHAEVMKKLVDNVISGGADFTVEQYLVLFLKFIASVVPTIQYDYTMSVGGS